MSRPPDPTFVHHGFEGGAMCCAVDVARRLLAIGSANGVVHIFDLRTHLHVQTIALGKTDGVYVQSVGFVDELLYVQIRGRDLRLFRHKEGGYVEERKVDCDFVAFCGTISIGNEIFFPSTSNCKQIICSFDTKSNESREIWLDTESTPMCMTSSERGIVVGHEDGSVSVVSTQTFTVLHRNSVFKEPVFCVTSSKGKVALGSSKPPIHLFADESFQSFNEIDYPTQATGCSAIVFSPNGKQLLAGFWDGSMRVFSATRATVLLHLAFHTATVSALLWTPVAQKHTVFVSSTDTRVSVWNFS